MNIDFFVAKNGYEHLTIDALKNMIVGVHWNVREKTFSIVQMNSKHSIGKVIGYSDYVTLENGYVHISKSEQKKVQEGGHKTRHALICGTIVDFDINAFANTLHYNPREVNSFVDKVDYSMGQVKYIESMDYVALAKIPSKEKPLVTYKNTGMRKMKATS
jgi:hypothetical protein